ncbi:proto-oncogene vav-like [Notothenia coriiceps]|uniref:Proto-oncogene vav-like n=1 Tax=Notothenia coriiceps TaxID=8208 RepID=A0A6I9PZW6_9TELE|nr:PREDICTED: proto-oncogene vav-like [Notothenia coriiceps]
MVPQPPPSPRPREEQPEVQQKIGVDKRECCLLEIRQTEEKYSDTLQSILQHFMKPLQKFLQEQDIESIFINIEELANTHRTMLAEVRSSILDYGAKNLYQVFLSYKERLLLYGHYCSQVETATKTLDKLSTTREDIRMKLEECSNRANSRRFSLRDLLMVPMQRVLKYHLLLQELLKHTTDAADKENLRTALDAMRDLAQCVNEVKRDNEIIRQITTFQLSIENMTQSLALYGRPKIDGELKICSPEKKSKQDRYAFLFDKAMFICKKKGGETFELKEIVELQHYQIRDEAAGEKDNKKWSYVFLLLDCYGKCGYDLFFKTRELKKKWLEQFEMAHKTLDRLQYIQNSAARVLTRTKRWQHITPTLFNLHWLPVKFCITYKLLLITYKSLHALSPQYLTDLLHPYIPSRTLRSSDSPFPIHASAPSETVPSV